MRSLQSLLTLAVYLSSISAAAQTPTVLSLRVENRSTPPAPRIVVAPDAIGAPLVGFAVSRAGLVALADRDSRVTIRSSDGTRSSTVGRRGRGPGEYASITAMAWAGDTLVVLDMTARRITYLSATGQTLVTLGWNHPGIPARLLESGDRLIVVAHQNVRSRVPYGGRDEMLTRPIRHFFRLHDTSITTLPGSQPDSSAFRPAPGTLGSDCEDETGAVHIFSAPFPVADLLAFMNDSTRIHLDPESGTISVRTPGRPYVVRSNFAPREVTDSLWMHVASRYLSVRALQRLECRPSFVRPRTQPVARALGVNGAGRLWVEVADTAGQFLVVIEPRTGMAIRWPLPAGRDGRFALQVRGEDVFFVALDGNGLQSLRTFRLQARPSGRAEP